MTPEMQQEIQLDQRLARIESKLSRICFELDLIINGVRHLLTIKGQIALADALGEQLEQIHQERSEAESDTLPPDAQ